MASKATLFFMVLFYLSCSALSMMDNQSDDYNLRVARSSWPKQKGTMVRILKRSIVEDPDDDTAITEPEEIDSEEADEEDLGYSRSLRSGLFLRSSRANEGHRYGRSGIFLRSSRPNSQEVPRALRNGLLLRTSKRGLFLRSSRPSPSSDNGNNNKGLFLRSFKRSNDNGSLYLRSS